MARYGSLTYKRYGPLGDQLAAIHRNFDAQAAAVVIDTMFYLGSAVKDNTPYRTGRATAHWMLALNGRPGGYDPNLVEGRGQAIDVKDIESYSLGDRVHLYNKAPYAAILDDGWSNQIAPGQMLRAQAARFSEFVERAARDNDLI